MFLNYRKAFGLAQIPVVIGLFLMAIAIPIVTTLTQQSTENRGRATGCRSTGQTCGSVFGNCCSGNICVRGYCALEEGVSVCLNDSVKCQNSQEYTCQGNTWVMTKNCDGGCDGDHCRANVCSPGVHKCESDRRYRCTDDGMNWQAVQDCFYGCQDSFDCNPPPPTPTSIPACVDPNSCQTIGYNATCANYGRGPIVTNQSCPEGKMCCGPLLPTPTPLATPTSTPSSCWCTSWGSSCGANGRQAGACPSDSSRMQCCPLPSGIPTNTPIPTSASLSCSYYDSVEGNQTHPAGERWCTTDNRFCVCNGKTGVPVCSNPCAYGCNQSPRMCNPAPAPHKYVQKTCDSVTGNWTCSWEVSYTGWDSQQACEQSDGCNPPVTPTSVSSLPTAATPKDPQ